MYAPTAELMDSTGQAVAITHVVKGRTLTCVRSRRIHRSGKITAMSVRVSPDFVTIVTVGGRHLTCGGAQKIAVRGRGGKLEWKRAWGIRPGQTLYAIDEDILVADRISCVVKAEKQGEPWITIATADRNLFVEEILCRAL